jgi:hypothetical protein
MPGGTAVQGCEPEIRPGRRAAWRAHDLGIDAAQGDDDHIRQTERGVHLGGGDRGRADAPAGGRTDSLRLELGVSLPAGAVIVAPLALSIRLPFAADRQDPGCGRPGPMGPDRGDR